MKDSLSAADARLTDTIMYEIGLSMINDVKMLLSYLDYTKSYDKYKMLDILEKLGRPNHFKDRIKWPEMDRWENAEGEFGLAPTNPILAVDNIGQLAYLSHLRWEGKPVVFFGGTVVDPAIFEMHVFSFDGSHLDHMYFDPFHRYYSKSVPRGYTWADEADGLTGTGCGVQEEFADSIDLIYSDAKEMFGVALVSPQLTKFNVDAAEKLWLEYKTICEQNSRCK